ncbi:MAG TPA: beta-ketoacyl-ACP synthase III [Aggregatilineales bacterium]|nr:beta-ketoacyl-ACP synthase III [Aggregatilineales bacterium]
MDTPRKRTNERQNGNGTYGGAATNDASAPRPTGRMALSTTVCYAHITGWGMHVPAQVVTNADLEALVETTDEWIRSRTGIQERRLATEKESVVTLGFEAAHQAMERADVLPRDIDLIIVATSTPEDVYPSTASRLQNMLGATRAGAFDLSAACSGFVYALNMGAQAIRSRSIERALIIGTELNSRVLDWNDRSTCVLFGDGAGAVVLEGSDDPGGLLSCILGSDGSGAGLLGIPTVGRAATALPEGQHLHKIHMDGREVFRFAVHILHESIRDAVDSAGLVMDDIALIIPHQANQRILNAAARSLNIPESMFYSNVAHYGNTSAASIPIALFEAERDGRVQPNDNIVLVGFGGGLTWASAVVQWQGVKKPEKRGLVQALAQSRREVGYVAAFWRDRTMRAFRRVEAGLRGSPAKQAALREERAIQQEEKRRRRQKPPKDTADNEDDS